MSAVEQATEAILAEQAVASVPPIRSRGLHAGRTRQRSRYTTQLLLTGVPLFVSDLLAITTSTILAFEAAGIAWPTETANPASFLLFLIIALPVIYSLHKLYPGTGLNPIVELRQSTLATVSIYAAFLTVSVVHDGRQDDVLPLATACLLSIVVVPVSRSVTRRILCRYHWWGQPMLIFGGNSVGQKSYAHFVARPHMGLRPIGIVDDLPYNSTGFPAPPYLGPTGNAPTIAKRRGVFWGVVAIPDGSPTQAREIIETHAANFPHLLVVPNMVGLPTLWNGTLECGGQPAIQMRANLLLTVPRLIKRTLDVTLVIFGGLIALPLILLIAVWIKATSPGPAFYRQHRIGYDGRRFYVWKYRTMVEDAETILGRHLDANPAAREEWERDSKLKDDPRITRIGMWLRRTSLDELPQIWNVLTGEMSLVGPRPIMNSEVPKYCGYKESFDLYTKVLPGITGLWQVSGRSNTTYHKRVSLDTYYVRNWSPWLDIYILARTVKVVLRREGAY